MMHGNFPNRKNIRKSETSHLSLLDYVRGLMEGEIEMVFAADVPYVMVQQVTASKPGIAVAGNAKQINSVECQDVLNDADSPSYGTNQFVIGAHVLSPLGYKLNNKTGNFELPENVRSSFRMYVTSPPKNGEAFVSSKEHFIYAYRANEGYIGPDSFTIGVDTLTISGKKIHFNLVFNLAVVEQYRAEDEPPICESMKFSALQYAPISVSWGLTLPIVLSNLSVSYVGKTTGSGPSAQITQDTAAAGYALRLIHSANASAMRPRYGHATPLFALLYRAAPACPIRPTRQFVPEKMPFQRQNSPKTHPSPPPWHARGLE